MAALSRLRVDGLEELLAVALLHVVQGQKSPAASRVRGAHLRVRESTQASAMGPGRLSHACAQGRRHARCRAALPADRRTSSQVLQQGAAASSAP